MRISGRKNLALGLVMSMVCSSLVFVGARAGEQDYDLVIRGGLVYDGLGGEPVQQSVAVRGDRIAYVGPRQDLKARRTIDAKGLAVTPGFIDPHSHILESVVGVDGKFLVEQNLAQGITTAVIGADGALGIQRLKRVKAALATKGTTQNYFCYIGHNGVRNDIMPGAKPVATEAELAQMKAEVEAGMRLGCVGLSAGLMYDPGMFSAPEEIVALARAIQPFDGVFDSHSRDPVNEFLKSELETAEIGIAAGVPAKLGHIKSVGLRNKGQASSLINHVRALRAEGYEIVGDVYPYDGAQTRRLIAVLQFPDRAPISPSEPRAALMDELRASLADPVKRAALKAATEQGVKGGFSWVKAVGYDSIRIVDAPSNPELMDSYISVMAENRGVDGFTLLTDLLLAVDSDVIVTVGAMDETDVQAFIAEPWNMISSDGSYIGKGSVYGASPHPRSSGSFARVLGHYARDLKLITLSEAVRKMTSLPADHLRLYDRGRIVPGAKADIAIFDAATIADKATYVAPQNLAVGMHYVLVNGSLVWAQNKPTGATPGTFIQRQLKKK
ncbi:N-acyl-D-amino-acid deacylase family protein [Govanella unica]|uniref:Amidohydrolase family protein n=1 Tax=Govanella unica TaxID=2975056 RepID=A0A9X3Z8K8_9PROT|nr:amidohydrolase family protein [Govania unica]MDA5195136.1 amidohydrolase family protein [Govania unica]